MLVFDFLFLIILLVFYLIFKRDKKLTLIVAIGLMCGVLLASYKALFLFSRRIVPYSFISNFAYFNLRQSFVPCVVLFVLFALIFKDTLKSKIEYFLPLELSFYMVYLPYCIVSTSEGLYSKYSLFFKPVVYAAMLFQCSISLKIAFEKFEEKKTVPAVIHSVIIFVYLLIPSFIECLFYLDDKFILPLIMTLAVSALPVFFIVVSKFKTTLAE